MSAATNAGSVIELPRPAVCAGQNKSHNAAAQSIATAQRLQCGAVRRGAARCGAVSLSPPPACSYLRCAMRFTRASSDSISRPEYSSRISCAPHCAAPSCCRIRHAPSKYTCVRIHSN